jgi:hypothetical protein
MKVQCCFERSLTISSRYSVICYKTPNSINIPVRTTKLRVLQFVPAPLSEGMKVKQSHYRLGQVLRVPGVWGSQVSRQSAHEGGKVVSSTHRPPVPPSPRKYYSYSFLLEAESTPGPYCGRKDCVNEKFQGIEPATFRLVAQFLNQMRHHVPPGEDMKAKGKGWGGWVVVGSARKWSDA